MPRLTTLLLLAALLAACGVRETAQAPAEQLTSLPATEQPTSPPTFPTITLSPFEATNVAAKATAMARFENAMASAAAEPTLEVWPTLPPNPTYDPSLNPRGFVSCEPAPWDQVLIENCWAEQINGVRVAVIAGTLKADHGQGALQVRDEVYLTPTRSGRARIVQADGLFLTVRTKDGGFFGFDAATLQWSAPQQTVTPRPLEDYPQGMLACENSPTTFLPGNCWALLAGNRYYQLRAGASQDEPLQGYLIVTCQNIQPGEAGCERRRYNTPSQSGRVEIVQADGAALTLRAENNDLFAFDLDLRQWVAPLATPIPTIAPLDATKQADEELMEQRRATSMARPTVTAYPTLIPEGTPYIPPGEIEQDCETAFFKLYIPANCWSGLWDGQILFFVAGSTPSNRDQGLVGMYVAEIHGDASGFDTYLTPAPTGYLMITELALPRFTLRSRAGATYVFNVETREWEMPAAGE